MEPETVHDRMREALVAAGRSAPLTAADARAAERFPGRLPGSVSQAGRPGPARRAHCPVAVPGTDGSR
ncbi:hypothetical protein GCM10010145_16950 [Streptomyces ruber]|uniref:Uncharacterized protein n=2 Tax=Streptomyces TaxID=1883 RepID=A0A918BA99_9ACTN|nr:hypothetical protein GCM10010145_16950 [Streptomyces ruber]